VALDPVLLAVSDQGFEGCDEVIHTMRKTQPADRVQTEVCHTGRRPECQLAYGLFNRRGDLSSLRYGIS
jgi:hypothetical protein